MKLDAVTLAVMNSRLAAIAEEMGVVLGQTGFSPNIKERRDYSCAIFDRRAASWSRRRRISRCISARPRCRCAPRLRGWSLRPATSPR